VTFFFILSCFVLTYANVAFVGTDFVMRNAPQRFITERVARLWPAYLVGSPSPYQFSCTVRH